MMNFSEKLFLPIIAGLLLCLAVILNAGFSTHSNLDSSAQASGAVTNTDDQPGQVYVTTEEDGVMYLTTTSSPDPADTAADSDSILESAFNVPEGFADNITEVLQSVLSFVMIIAALLVLFYLIWGAFDWISSGGDKGKIDQARQKIVAAVIGIIIVSASYAVFLLVINFIGFTSAEDLFENIQTINGRNIVIQETPTPSASPTSALDAQLQEATASSDDTAQ